MISKLIYSFERAVVFVKEHPQLFFVLVLMFVMPLLFLYSGQQFLNVARENQDRLQKDRIGILHDSFVSVLYATNFASTTAQSEINRLVETNPDILTFSVSHLEGRAVKILAGNDALTINTNEPYTDYYRSAAVRVDESLIFETYDGSDRIWLVYRAIEASPGDFYFIYSQMSLAQVDKLFFEREREALWSLSYVYAFIIALAYWHIRLTDYRFLYMAAQKQSKMKDLFTNMIAHELRAPLTAIRGYASMMGESSEAADRLTYSQRIRESSERLLGIVNDLLDVARIQSGKLQVQYEAYDITKVIEAVLREQQVAAKEKNIQLVGVGITDPFEMYTDPKRLQQALTNLVSNSIKYTAAGAITVALTSKPEQVEIRVKDTGMGISSADQRKLFAPFFRVDRDDVSNITGTGLGMWITRQLIEMLGGTVGVESISGVGTHVVVLLPIKPK